MKAVKGANPKSSHHKGEKKGVSVGTGPSCLPGQHVLTERYYGMP